MNSSVESFSFGVKPVRVVEVNGEPWFVASDVCSILEITNGRDAVSRLSDDERGVASADTLGGRQQVSIVSEPGLYRLIFTSRKDEAEPFRRWVAHEVLPQIRKTGSYAPQNPILTMSRLDLLKLAVASEEANQALSCQVQEMTPKANFHDRVALATDGQSVAEVAKILGTGQNRLYQWLRGKKFLMADNLPYQEHLDCGRFRVIEQTWEGKTSTHTSTKTLVTGKGVIWLQRLWDEENTKAVA